MKASEQREAAISFVKEQSAWLLSGTADDLEELAAASMSLGLLSDEWHRGVAFSVTYMADRVNEDTP